MRYDFPRNVHYPGGRKILMGVAVAALVFITGAVGTIAGTEGGGTGKTGRTPPMFTLRTLQGEAVDGKTAARQMRPMLLNFWGIRCQSCLEELPHLATLHEEFGQKVSFYGINVDGIDGDYLKRQMEKSNVKIPYGVVADPEMKLLDLFGMTAAPLTILIGPEGTIRYEHEGFALGDEERLKRAIQEILSGK